LNSLIAQIPGVGTAFASMLPIAGVLLAIEIIGKLIAKHSEAAEKMQESNAAAAHGIFEVFNGLDEKLLSVQKKADELAHNHLAALKIALKEIDNTSLKELEGAFNQLTKDAITQIKDLKGEWYSFMLVTSGQAHALIEFKDKYQAALDAGKTKEAADLLSGTLKSAKDTLEEYKKSQGTIFQVPQSQIDRQNILIQALENTKRAAEEAQKISTGEKANVGTEEQNRVLKEQAKLAEMVAKAKFDAGKIADASAKETTKVLTDQLEQQVHEEERAAREKSEALKSFDKEMLAADASYVKNQEALAKLGLDADKEAARHKAALHQSSIAARLAEEQKEMSAEWAVEEKGYDHSIAIAEAFYGKDSAEAMKAHQSKELAERKHQEEMKKIVDKGEEDQAKLVLQAESRMADGTAAAVNKMLFSHKSVAAAFAAMGREMVEGALKNVIKMILTNDMEKLSNAEVAASRVMASLPFPINIPAAAAVFAATMAFAAGGLVPGSGDGDTVPAMLTPGETVVTKALTQRVAQSEGRGQSGGQGHVIQHSPTYHVSTMDSRGFSSMLQKHDAEFQAHAVATMRKLNMRAGRG
jgi:hypothetical protein